MFIDKNKIADIQDLDKSKEQIPENLPIHTMLKDLDTLENPEKAVPVLFEKTPTPPIANHPPEIQKIGSFLTTPSDKIEIKKSLPEIKNKLPEVPKKEGALATNVGKLIAAVLIILIISVLGIGGYYFWNPRSLNPEPVTKVSVEPKPEPVPTPTPVPVPKFTTEGINIFSIDLSSASSADIQAALFNLVGEVKKENLNGPIEFSLVDKDNNLIAFKNFSQKFELGLSINLINSFSEKFSLFIYNDNGNYRLGLAIDYKKGVDLKKLMRTEEPTLLTELKPLFLDAAYSQPRDKKFSDNVYKNFAVRYENIVSPEYLSIDYIANNKTLFIGTTRLTAQAMVDYLEKQLPQAPVIP